MHRQIVMRAAVWVMVLYGGWACATQPRSAALEAAFDPLQYPGDAALTCDVIGRATAQRVALVFTGTDSAPAMQRRITAVFDGAGAPRMLEVLAPQPGRTPPRAHWIRVSFQPDLGGSHAVVDSGGGADFISIMQSADAAAQPLDSIALTRVKALMGRLWARRCNLRHGAAPRSGEPAVVSGMGARIRTGTPSGAV